MNRAAWRECGVTGIFATDSSKKANLDLVSEIIICGGSSFLLDTGAERLFNLWETLRHLCLCTVGVKLISNKGPWARDSPLPIYSSSSSKAWS